MPQQIIQEPLFKVDKKNMGMLKDQHLALIAEEEEDEYSDSAASKQP